MKPPKYCETCESYHHDHQAHVFASNFTKVAINKPAINTPSAINGVELSDEKRRRIFDAESGAVDRKPRAGGKRAAGGVVDAELPKPAVVAQVAAGERGAKTGNRRNRADYNAYMKGYMAKKRKKKDASGGDESGTPTLE